jgi:CopG-like RHH_1 or ribbon-helix-helix domain, RHH_5
MKRTTVSLPKDLAPAFEREARRRGVPVSQLAQEAIEARLVASKGGGLASLLAGLGLLGWARVLTSRR